MEFISQNILNEITNRLVTEFHPEKIYLFGSYAWGTPDKDSDLDILVVVKESQLKPALRASNAYRCLRGIKIPVDVLVKTKSEFEFLHRVHASLVSTIFDEGKILYG